MLTSATDGRTTLVQRSYNTALHHHAADNLYKNKKCLRYSARALRDALPCGAEARFLLRDTSCQPGWQRVCREWADGGQWKTIDSMSKDDGGVCWQATVAEHRTPPRTSVRRHCREKVAYIAEQVHGRGEPYLRQPCGTVGRKTLSRYRRATVAQYRPHTTMRHPSQKQVQYCIQHVGARNGRRTPNRTTQLSATSVFSAAFLLFTPSEQKSFHPAAIRTQTHETRPPTKLGANPNPKITSRCYT